MTDDNPREQASTGDQEPDGATKSLAEAITEARLAAGLTQAELAQRVGVDQSVVSTWVRGRSMPTLERIVALDEAMGLRPGTLLERAGIIKRPSVEEVVEADPELDDAGRQEVWSAYHSARVHTTARLVDKIEEQIETATGRANYHDEAARVAAELDEVERANEARKAASQARRLAERLAQQRAAMASRLVDLMAKRAPVPADVDWRAWVEEPRQTAGLPEGFTIEREPAYSVHTRRRRAGRSEVDRALDRLAESIERLRSELTRGD